MSNLSKKTIASSVDSMLSNNYFGKFITLGQSFFKAFLSYLKLSNDHSHVFVPYSHCVKKFLVKMWKISIYHINSCNCHIQQNNPAQIASSVNQLSLPNCEYYYTRFFFTVGRFLSTYSRQAIPNTAHGDWGCRVSTTSVEQRRQTCFSLNSAARQTEVPKTKNTMKRPQRRAVFRSPWQHRVNSSSHAAEWYGSFANASLTLTWRAKIRQIYHWKKCCCKQLQCYVIEDGEYGELCSKALRSAALL